MRLLQISPAVQRKKRVKSEMPRQKCAKLRHAWKKRVKLSRSPWISKLTYLFHPFHPLHCGVSHIFSWHLGFHPFLPLYGSVEKHVGCKTCELKSSKTPFTATNERGRLPPTRRLRKRGTTFGLRPSPSGFRLDIRPPASTLWPLAGDWYIFYNIFYASTLMVPPLRAPPIR